MTSHTSFAHASTIPASSGSLPFNRDLRADFPLLAKNPQEVFLDSAASAQKPEVVLRALGDFYASSYANIHRGVYDLSIAATERYEQARATTARFIGALPSEVVFTKNSTEGLNLVAHGLAGRLDSNSVVLCSTLEHHSNFLPWLAVAKQRGASVRLIPVGADGALVLDNLDALFADVRILAITGMSNVTGEIVDLTRLVEAARAVGAVVVVDGAQLVPHHPVNVVSLGVDILAFSGHKLGAPSGIGVLWGKSELLEEMPPFLLGGGMIADVTESSFTPAPVPEKFEAGTPPIGEAVALGAALDYLTDIDMGAVRAHELKLVTYGLNYLRDRFGNDIRIHGPLDPTQRGGVFSFTFEDLHPHDIGQVLNDHHVSVRAGHHCAKPLMRALQLPATTRASVWVYNTTSDFDALGDGLEAVSRLLGRKSRRS